MTQKKSAAPSEELVDLDPVELDPPSPEIVRWRQLAERETIIYHDGDATNIIPFPRPAWADPDCDIVSDRLDRCYYTTEFARIPVSTRAGAVDADAFMPAHFDVRAKLGGDGHPIVGMGLRWRNSKGEWCYEFSLGVTPAEALEFADVLRAAVDLLGGV
jgi:hypothetical protein